MKSIHGKDIKIFACNSNKKLAEDIAAAMGLPLGRCTVGAFADGEVSISIEESVRGSDVFVVQSTCGPVNNNLMELLIMIDALKRASAGRITAVVPYYGYARQDRKAKARDPISAKLVADLISVAGADRVLSMDLHVAQIQGFFNIPVDPAENEEEGDWMTPMEILSFLQTKTKDRLSINKVALFGRALHKLGISSRRKTRGTEYHVVKKE